MTSSPGSDTGAPPERVLAAYAGEELVIVLRRGAGPIYAPEEDGPPLFSHGALSGQFVSLVRVNEVLDSLSQNPTVEGVISSLETLGFEIEETPVSALSWVLD